MNKTVTAIFDNTTAASTAIDRLVANGVAREKISTLMSEGTRNRDFTVETKTKMPEGAATGAVTGGAIGAIIAGIIGTGALSMTGVGLVAAGPLVAVLSGLGVGAATGGTIGALVGLGIPEHEAQMAADKIENGGVLVGVEAEDSDEADHIEDLMQEVAGHSVKQSAIK